MTASRISSHGLDAPSEADVLASLTRFVGGDQAAAAWQSACVESGVQAGSLTTPDALSGPLTLLKSKGGYEAVAASSLLVRVRTYALLSRTPVHA